MTTESARAIRDGLDHPILDADGHTVEYLPALIPYFQKAGVADDLKSFFERIFDPGTGMWGALSPAERVRRRAVRPSWWAVPARNTLDFATASMPTLMAERMDELGLDFSVIYPSMGLPILDIPDDRLRRASLPGAEPVPRRRLRGHRATARAGRRDPDGDAGRRDRGARVRGAAARLQGRADRELRAPAGRVGREAWAARSRCRRPGSTASASIRSTTTIPSGRAASSLGISPAAHSGAVGWDGHRSPSNYMFNHLGFFATPAETLCRSLFLGGVTNRFPKLRLALLEGGASWAARLLHDLVGHYEKRNPVAIQHYNPASFDRGVWNDLFERHGAKLAAMASSGPDIHQLAFGSNDRSAPTSTSSRPAASRPKTTSRSASSRTSSSAARPTTRSSTTPSTRTRSRAVGRFARSSAPTSATGTSPTCATSSTRPSSSSRRAASIAKQFRAFTFENAARFYTDTNPRFFEGTAIESDVAKLLAKPA